jgi:hypothetical protein
VNFDTATAELRKLGITLRRLPGEFQVNLTGGPDENAITAETLDDAVALGRSRSTPRVRLLRAFRPPMAMAHRAPRDLAARSNIPEPT